jgi:hypothetical protein
MNKNIRLLFFENLCLQCIALLINAYKLAIIDKIYNLEWDEDQFTALLVGKYLSELKIKGHWSISPQQPYYTNKHIIGEEHPTKAPRPDIHFEKYIFENQRPFEFTIEAKNIKANDSHLKGRYIETGIDNFKTRRYPNGCLAGYIVQGTVSNCIDGINVLLEKRDRITEKLSIQSIINLYDNVYVSKHVSDNDNIELKHIFLEFYNN